MKIELVFCERVNGFEYYDVHCEIDGKDFTIVPVMYSNDNYCWYVKLPDRPLFVSALYSNLINYICNIVRELFNL